MEIKEIAVPPSCTEIWSPRGNRAAVESPSGDPGRVIARPMGFETGVIVGCRQGGIARLCILTN